MTWLQYSRRKASTPGAAASKRTASAAVEVERLAARDDVGQRPARPAKPEVVAVERRQQSAARDIRRRENCSHVYGGARYVSEGRRG